MKETCAIGLNVCPTAIVAAPIEVVWEFEASINDSIQRLKRASEAHHQKFIAGSKCS